MMRVRGAERAVVVTFELKARQSEAGRMDRRLAEMEALAKTAGALVVDRVGQELARPNPALLIGQGKTEELRARCDAARANLVLFGEDLKPSQQRNLERLLDRKVVDRTGLILDIFAQRARTQEGKLQVELAQLLYMLPRLSGGPVLSQLAGGIGTRGPGEQKLELDRRRIRDRISRLRTDITHVRRHRAEQRKARQEIPLPLVSLVGYTNAGKSTLLNALTHAEVLTENLLFATLDPTTRRLPLPHAGDVLVTDTVGFIEDLSPHLIAAFKATLEELSNADLLLHVMDASQGPAEQRRRRETVEKIVKELGAADTPTILVYNKADALPPEERVLYRRPAPGDRDAALVSAKDGEGLPALQALMEAKLGIRRDVLEVLVPYAEGQVVDRLHQFGTVLEERHKPQGTWIRALVDRKFAERLKAYRAPAETP